MAKTLEQETEETEMITEKCHDCGSELQIPKGISLEKNKQYRGFYVSPSGSIYCNRDCFTMFTED